MGSERTRNVVYNFVILSFLSTSFEVMCSFDNEGGILKSADRIVSNGCSSEKNTNPNIPKYISRHPRDLSYVSYAGNSYGNAVYFSGKEVLKLKRKGKFSHVEVPNGNFTVSLWIKAEGGQFDPITIVGIFDVCNGQSSNSGWQIGITRYNKGNLPSPRFYFSMQSDRTRSSTRVFDVTSYTPQKWTYVTVTYDGAAIRMYIGRTHVATSYQQHGPLFGSISKKCKEIRLGGGLDNIFGFRGAVDELRIFDIPLNQSDIVAVLSRDQTRGLNRAHASLYDDFSNTKGWRKASRRLAQVIKSDITLNSNTYLLKTPPCGKTICDNPVLVKSYLNNAHLRSQKQLRYRVINLNNDNGTEPQITDEQLRDQHAALQNAFSVYNISWMLDPSSAWEVFNSALRRKLVLMSCDPWDVGDGICNKECLNSRTGYDGGDCQPFIPTCNISSLRNERCDYECNKEYHLWDGGDCCKNDTDSNLQCFDPKSQYRGYLGVREYKERIGLDSSRHCNVYLASKLGANFVGLSTMPWDQHVHDVLGGVVVQYEKFGMKGHSKGLVHELGHVLGLWHVHHGISEMDCSDPCLEKEPSMELGDLCSDTAPTPSNKLCQNPDGLTSSCGITSFHNTPFRNYMSYADDDCTDHFTPQQVARMHCYIDLVYRPWTNSPYLSPVPLAPRVIGSDSFSVTLQWIPPLSSYHVTSPVCELCNSQGVLSQYASNSTSSHPSGLFHMWTPDQAQGPPDAEPCELSDRAWIPEVLDCLRLECFLEVEYAIPVIPVRLTIWVVYTSEGWIEEIELIHTDQNSSFLYGPFLAFCDTELTIPIQVTAPINKIKIYISNPHVAIDAVEISTGEKHRTCKSCKSIRYNLSRDPPFPTGRVTQVTSPKYVDRSVQPNVTYSYTVTVSAMSLESVPSPALIYSQGQPYCSDGQLDGGEECDDGNMADGDGCDVNCKTENFFRCTGSPSLCYWHDGDGVCEDFEKESSLKDCGYYTPEGFDDQWAERAEANQDFQRPECPTSLLTGIPSLSKEKCQPEFNTKDAWHPCGHLYAKANFWIEVYFAKAVVATEIIIHFRSDGTSEFDLKPHIMRVELLTPENKTVTLNPETIAVSCKRNPFHIPVTKDLTQPFFLSKGVRLRFDAFNISIGGVRMRSSKYLNPVNIAACKESEVFNPKSGMCVGKTCSLPACDKLYLNNGRSSCSGFREGDICNVTCDNGYRLSNGLNEYICLNGSWENPSPLQCIPIRCQRPEIPLAIVACPYGTDLHQNCTFKCKSPARLQGVGTTLQCEADGYWSLPTSYCQVQCPSPPSRYGNAKLITKKCKRGTHAVGTRCRFKCNKGYHVKDKKPTKRNLKLICGEGGEWNGDMCTRITCLPIDPVFTGLYSCTNLNYGGSKCTLRCPGGQGIQAIKCTAKGDWTDDFTMCPSGIQGACPALTSSEDIIFHCPDNYVGYQCEVKCMLPNSKPIMAGRTNKVRGKLNGPITTFLTVHQLTCTALLEWLPDPSTLMCVQSCKAKYIYDGWCDAENNREVCEWDGGDCCDSTSKDGVAIPFPETCKEQCACLDPNAEENKRKKTKKKRRKKKKMRKNKKSSRKTLMKIKSKRNTTVAQTVRYLKKLTSLLGDTL